MGLFNKIKKEDRQSKPATPKKDVEKKEEQKISMKDLYGSSDVKNVKSASDTKDSKTRKLGDAYKVLVKPVVTEKAAHLGTENKYVFAVKMNANKIEIAKAISEVYGIEPININVSRVRGKSVRYGRTFGQRKGWKKAVITLPAGKTINIYEGV